MNLESLLYRELSEEELERCALHYLGKPLLDWRILSGGLFNTTYLLITEDDRVVMRLGPVNRHLLLPYEHGLMEAECAVQELLASRGIPTSRTRILDSTHNFLQRDVAIVEYIDARNYGEGRRTHSFEAEVCRQTGAWVRKIHDITAYDLPSPPQKPYGRVSLVLSGNGCASWKEAILEELSQWRDKAEETALFSEEVLCRIDCVFQRSSHLFDCVTQPRLTHGDIWMGNLLVNADGTLAALIDADRAFFGDPEMDRVLDLIPRKSFEEGYAGALDNSKDACLRRELYKFLLHLEDCYILQHEYCRYEDARELKDLLLQRLKELENK